MPETSYSYLIGTPYLKGGTDIKTGLNCYGLCKVIYHDRGVEIPYYDHPDDKSLIHQMIISGKELCEELIKPEPFCFVVFSLRRPTTVDHLGVVLERTDYFIHILKNKGCCIQRLSDPFYKQRIQGFFKWKQNIS